MIIENFIKEIELKYKNHYFSGICFDSSRCKKDNIFFAIKGNKIDGNKFINHAIQKGAKTIISNQKFEGVKKNILFIRSSNVRKSLSEFAYSFYKDKPKNIIAITGTNGKSSIADFYFQILKLNKRKVASIGTLGIKTQNNIKKVSNTTIDPITLSIILNKLKKEGINDVILEASSHGLKQNRLDGLKFKTGIFTNLSHDHLDYHKTFNDYLKSKLYLFEKLLKKNANIITDKEIPQYKKIKEIALKNRFNIETISNNSSNLEVISHEYHNEKQIVEIKYNKNIYKFKTRLIGKIQIKNILMAMIAASKSGLSLKKIIDTIDNLKPVSGRLEQIGTIKNNSKVILDYAHTPDALETSLKSLKEQFKNRKIAVVFGCGGDRDKAKRPMMGKIVNQYCDKIYLTDDNPRYENPKKIRNSIRKNINKSKICEISDRASAIKNAIFDLKTGDILIVAGKGHEKIQEYKKIKKLFSDQQHILKNISIKNKTLSNNLKLNILKELSNSNHISSKLKIKNASINSKEIKKNDVFFAIKGRNKNGNLFVNEALAKGASLAIVNNQKKLTKKIVVKDTLKFLTEASSILRENLSSKIISITGSCGKTSLKELIAKSLNKISQVTYSPKSFNNKFGVPLSLFNLKTNDAFGIFEIGMDKKGEIDYLSKIIKPDVGVITNISYAHIKNFKNINQIALAKSEIIKNIKDDGYLILNKDDKFYNLHKQIGLKKKLRILSFSLKNKSATTNLNSISKKKSKYKISINVNKKKIYFFSNSIFENDLKNLLATITIISIFKDIHKLDKNIFYDHKTTNGRGDIVKIKLFKKFFYLVDESYNSNPLSLKSALINFDMIKVDNSKKHLVLGDMLELGKYSKKLHIEIGKTINKTSLKNVNVIGEHVKWTFNNINKSRRGIAIKKKSQIIDLIKNNLNNNDYLMIKGSNSTGLNSLANQIKTGKINAL
ncbi:bifunctional UDP-N-acetylmuramoyl-L-alanyl-D-glutamate--2,6-diaminopimelate ligase MurE/UDP-N-acetylmuramoyl-tripeptide--D-alanyl-D-alanine ligase MurF [Candidatus Pelagibacter sp.]|nr:bifunctional UDP-N-acetylmuramoyl-L-alanyl-D-glutamate--2,6-diaminopimelate ligase MurE/UDP-N-acetylmuramoyl-tripeptide--D-alanyl-D-alanine ligase MurF [Candidatus Pelagibacter sp.]